MVVTQGKPGLTLPQQENDSLALPPHTPKNKIVTTMVEDLLQLGKVTLSPFGVINAGPSVSSFDAIRIYFDCVTDAHETAAQVAVGCVITARGYTIQGQQLPKVTFSFAPTSPVGSTMALATLPSNFVNLKNLTLAIATADIGASQSVLEIDDFVHCNH